MKNISILTSAFLLSSLLLSCDKTDDTIPKSKPISSVNKSDYGFNSLCFNSGYTDFRIFSSGSCPAVPSDEVTIAWGLGSTFFGVSPATRAKIELREPNSNTYILADADAQILEISSNTTRVTTWHVPKHIPSGTYDIRITPLDSETLTFHPDDTYLNGPISIANTSFAPVSNNISITNYNPDSFSALASIGWNPQDLPSSGSNDIRIIFRLTNTNRHFTYSWGNAWWPTTLNSYTMPNDGTERVNLDAIPNLVKGRYDIIIENYITGQFVYLRSSIFYSPVR